MPPKKVKAMIKLQIPAGAANPAPPVGPALGQQGVNIMDFCKQFNERTKKMEQGMTIPVVITVFDDRSFTFITKSPPAAVLVKKALNVERGSAAPNKNKVGEITIAKIEEIDFNPAYVVLDSSKNLIRANLNEVRVR